MPQDDETKQLLRNLLDGIYQQQQNRVDLRAAGESYLIAADQQFLGSINANKFDNDSILNEYGPFGSRFSSTSIFNDYSPYGSVYGQFSLNNPYCTRPPQLFIRGQLLGNVSKNQFVSQLIPTDGFLYALQHNLEDMLAGRIVESEVAALQQRKDSFIAAEDGTFLGKLNPSQYDNESIFNKYGPYGSRYSQTCIFNQYGPYGSRYSATSPFNRYASAPPKVFVNGSFHAYLTVNTLKKPRMNPETIKEWAAANISR